MLLKWIAEKEDPKKLVELNATSVGVGRRNGSFLCMCSRNCIFNIVIIIIVIIIIINIVFFVVVMFQNCQVMVTSFDSCWYSGGPIRFPIVIVPATSRGIWVRRNGG